MANRTLLLKTDLGKFIEFITDRGWVTEKPRGTSQIVFARKQGVEQPLVVYTIKNEFYLSVYGHSEEEALDFYSL